MKKVLYFILTALIILIAVVFVRTFSFKSKQIKADPIEKLAISPLAKTHMSRAIQIKTVSPENESDFDSIQFDLFNAFLKETYPLTDSLLDHQVFNAYSHLYLWKGSDRTMKPAILMAHLDVVPVIEENRKYWNQDPFGGLIVQDTLWGRGSIDDKMSVVALMESVESLLKKGFQPKRDLYFALGHDEEIGGLRGAKVMAEHLKEKGIQAEFVLDEGGSITQGMVPGIGEEVALIGIAEKGFLTLNLSIELEGGHSSRPDKESAIDLLAGAVYRLKSNPLPAEIVEPQKIFMDYLGPHLDFTSKMAMANKEIFKPLIINSYAKSASGNALVRTTTAPTIFNAGVKDNIIPLSAKATVNFRVISGSSIADVIDHVKRVIDDDRVVIDTGKFNVEPSEISDVNSPNYHHLNYTVAEIFPKVLVVPYLVIGATDSRHFSILTDEIYRFLPVKITNNNVKSFHGLNERIPVSDLHNSIRFYTRFLENLDKS